MSLKIYNEYFGNELLQELISWNNKEDGTQEYTKAADNAGVIRNFRSKNFSDGVFPGVPLTTVHSIIKEFYKGNYIIDELAAVKGSILLPIHADSGALANGDTAINVALEQEAATYTVYFDNYWTGTRAKFVKGTDAPNGKFNQAIKDYSAVVNYTDEPFDIKLYEKYLKHINYASLHGLTVHSIIKNTPGTVMMWDRSMLHCTGYSTASKTALVVLLNADK